MCPLDKATFPASFADMGDQSDINGKDGLHFHLQEINHVAILSPAFSIKIN
jgi:hypothetical protein